MSITKEDFKDKEVIHLGKFLSQRRDCIKRIEKIDLPMEKTIKATSAELDHISTPTQPLPLKGEGLGGGPRLIDGYLSNLKSIMEAVDMVDTELMRVVKEEGEGIKRELLEMRNVHEIKSPYWRGVNLKFFLKIPDK